VKQSTSRIAIETSGKRSGGFTLTELLVIITVVAILLCLLVSAHAGAKDQSRVAQCANNLKQFTLALHINGGENGDKLPSNTEGYWAWDLAWSTGNIVTQWISFRNVYCPGTSARFADQDNLNLWNYGPGAIHVIGYALTLSGTAAVSATNQNSTLTAQRISLNGSYLRAPSPAQRVLLADATISDWGQFSNDQRYTYNWTDITGGYSKRHLTAHLRGQFPLGGNVGMLDGHVEWRKFDDMQCRVDPNYGRGGFNPGFWW
jgi:prepilin-type processing-associated H-X9-DG protein